MRRRCKSELFSCSLETNARVNHSLSSAFTLDSQAGKEPSPEPPGNITVWPSSQNAIEATNQWSSQLPCYTTCNTRHDKLDTRAEKLCFAVTLPDAKAYATFDAGRAGTTVAAEQIDEWVGGQEC